jgi:predicted metal-dependent enzyme (double-stranded beta helix superfamily)
MKPHTVDTDPRQLTTSRLNVEDQSMSAAPTRSAREMFRPTAQPPAPLTSPMLALVHDLDDITVTIQHNDRPAAIAGALSDYLGCANLLAPAHLRSDPHHYRTNIVHVDPAGAYSIVALVWQAGQRTPIHSHRSWCVVGVHEGTELERTFAWTHGHLVENHRHHLDKGSITWLSPGHDDIHDVTNSSSQTTVSIHIYGLDYRTAATSILDTFTSPVPTAA